jgi:hypothetical protein
MLRIFIGYDHRQPLSLAVLNYSILSRSSRPVSITPLVLPQLPIKRSGLTPFTFSRFLVPWLCGFEGPALFLDVDMLVQGDIAELFDHFDPEQAVMICRNTKKFEWASVMLFNCGHSDNRILTPDFVELGEGLHTINWTDRIGSLPDEWNHLVMYDEPKPAKLLHYTCGLPIYPETKPLGYAEEWAREAKAATSVASWQTLMGHSVHAKPVMERLKQLEEKKSPAT